MGTLAVTQTSLFTDGALDADTDAAWFAEHPGAVARCRLPRADEQTLRDEGARLVIVHADGHKRAVCAGPLDRPMLIRRWLTFSRDGELLDAPGEGGDHL